MPLVFGLIGFTTIMLRFRLRCRRLDCWKRSELPRVRLVAATPLLELLDGAQGGRDDGDRYCIRMLYVTQ